MTREAEEDWSLIPDKIITEGKKNDALMLSNFGRLKGPHFSPANTERSRAHGAEERNDIAL